MEKLFVLTTNNDLIIYVNGTRMSPRTFILMAAARNGFDK